MSIKDVIILNALGTKFEITSEKLQQCHESSRLGKLINHKMINNMKDILIYCDGYDEKKKEFFFNRDPDCLKMVLNYLLTGELHVKRNMCEVHVKNELEYWMIDPQTIKRCCYGKFNDNYEVGHGYIKMEEDVIRTMKIKEDYKPTLREKLWEIVSCPLSSKKALVNLNH